MIPRAYVDIQLRDEIIEHKVWDCCWKSDYTHAIGGILRPETDDIRITHDYGRPLGASINDNTVYLKMKWDSFDSLTDLVTKGSWIARADIRWYYRHFPVDPYDWDKLAFDWEFMDTFDLTAVNCTSESPRRVRHLYDMYLNFGLRNAGEIAGRCTAAVKYIAQLRGARNIVAVMDDFAVVDDSQAVCNMSFDILLGVLKELGFCVSTRLDKTHKAKQRTIWTGIEIDTLLLRCTLRPAKLEKFTNILVDLIDSPDSWQVSSTRTLCGLANWASRVVSCGRPRMHAMISTVTYLRDKPKHHHHRPTAQLLAEVVWWRAALHNPRFHGHAHIFSRHPLPMNFAETDARTPVTGTGCIGVFVDGGFVSLSYSQLCQLFDDVPDIHSQVTVWETYAVLVMLRLFSAALCGKHILIRIDNPGAAAGNLGCLAIAPLYRWSMILLILLFSLHLV